MQVDRKITLRHIFDKKTAPHAHVSFQLWIKKAKVKAVPFYHFQLFLPQKFTAPIASASTCLFKTQFAIVVYLTD